MTIDNLPVCTFKDECCFRTCNNKCKILTDMPMPRTDGVCPFSKKRISEIKK